LPFHVQNMGFPLHARASQPYLPISSLVLHHRYVVSCYKLSFYVLFIDLQDEECMVLNLNVSLIWCNPLHLLTSSQQENTNHNVCLD
jgi:hypothetical protein